MDKYTVLKQQFGLSAFRPGQEEMIDQILTGRDVMGIMPTGAGKSLCYQLPGLMLPGITVVISPLIALMKDQVASLNQQGIPAAYLNSSLNSNQYAKALENLRAGKYKMIYVAPERLESEPFQAVIQQIEISMITIDEAHCVSQWGHDFRPSYMRIPDFIDGLPIRPVVSAFTATATTLVEEDIVTRLKLRNPFTRITGFDRGNLTFMVDKPVNKLIALKSYVKQFKNKNGIIYCSTRKSVDEVCAALHKLKYSVTKYHAGLSIEERRMHQEDFIYDRKQWMVATNAFGMGIDKSNVSVVIHYNMPKNLESYYQEAGRAGRDGQKAECIILYHGSDVITNQFLIDISSGNTDVDPLIAKQIKEKEHELLKKMTFYCHATQCLRAYILDYFGEKTGHYCGNCSNCLKRFVTEDVTIEAQKIISCILRAKQRYGMGMILDILKGSSNKKILDLGLDQLSTYGIMKEMSRQKIRDITEYLIFQGYIEVTQDAFPILICTDKSNKILREGEILQMKIQKEYIEIQPKTESKSANSQPKTESKSVKTQPKNKKKTSKKTSTKDAELFEVLKIVRGELAKDQKVPAYIVFTDATLADMCRVKPMDLDAFLEVSGVGLAKQEKYGRFFIEAINAYLK